MARKHIRGSFSVKIGTVFVVALVTQALLAQNVPSKVYDEQLRVYLDEQSPTQRNVTLDAGGWLSAGFFDYDDGTAVDRTLRQYQLRGWARLNKRDIHKVYIRGLFNYEDWNAGSNPLGKGDDASERLERAWYQMNVNRFLGWDASHPVDLRVQVGRAFQTIGNSFTLAMPLDMVSIQADAYNWQITSFLGKTVFRSTNIDRSPLVATRQDRIFMGIELTYDGFSEHRPFAYFLGNWDHTDPSAVDLFQSYHYDSRYIGIGSRGIIGSNDLHYKAELVGEWGESYANLQTTGREHIKACAFDFLLEYYLDHPTQPKLMLEYMFGSGDADRGSSVATSGGNTANTSDNAFNAFGFRDTGIALNPAVSNLHIYTAGVSLFPLNKHRRFQKLEAGAKIFGYSKHRGAGAISDPFANGNAGCVGSEWDLFCNWRIASDLAWTARYGMFLPGSAYDGGDKSSRDFLYTGAIVSF